MTGQTDAANRDTASESDGRWRPTGRTGESSGEALGRAVVAAVADAEGVDPAELSSRPLYDSLDPGALDEDFFGLGPEDVPGDVERVVEFRYGEYRVTVSADGEVEVTDAT